MGAQHHTGKERDAREPPPQETVLEGDAEDREMLGGGGV